jgi:cell division protein FtsB
MKFFRSKLFRLVAIGAGLVIVWGLVVSVLDLNQRGDIVGELETELEIAEAENSRLKRDLEEAESPEFVEREAREKLGLARPGESIVIISTPMTDAGPAGFAPESTATPPQPGMKAWIELFK